MAKAQDKLNRAIRHLENLYQMLKTTKEELEKQLRSAYIDFTIINCHRNYIEKLKIDIRNQHKLIADIEVEVEEKKQEVLEAMKAKTMLEKLKEKKLEEFIKDFERRDLIEIDEISTNRHRRIN